MIEDGLNRGVEECWGGRHVLKLGDEVLCVCGGQKEGREGV